MPVVFGILILAPLLTAAETAVVQEFADVLNNYNLFNVEGDRYAGEWPREAFRPTRLSSRD